MKQHFSILALVFSSFATADDDQFFIGIWQSDEERTLASMSEIEDIPEKTKQFLHADFFGKLVNVVRKDSYATYFVDEKPKKLEFQTHKIEVLSSNTIRITFYDELTRSNITQTLEYEDNCYSLLVSRWNFREYFCRVE